MFDSDIPEVTHGQLLMGPCTKSEILGTKMFRGDAAGLEAWGSMAFCERHEICPSDCADRVDHNGGYVRPTRYFRPAT